MSTAYHTVHVRVNDAATGQPTPVRIRFTGPEGDYCPPFGRLSEFATGRNQDVGGNVLLGGKPYAYIDGSCEVRLPAGLIGVEIHKGPEYKPLQLETMLAPGKLALRFQIQRWINLRQAGWFSGDTRTHFLSPHAALLETAAEDLAVVNLLATECQTPGAHGEYYAAIPNILAFSGQRPALEMPGHWVVVNTYNSHPILGSLGLLNCHRIVFPLSFGGAAGKEDWSLADWCDQCHRKSGLVVWTKALNKLPGERLADLILGKIDAFEIDFFKHSPMDLLPDWYALLQCGIHVPLVGASGKDSNGIALGSMRTYARLQPKEELTYKNWIEALRAGRTFVTNSPLLSLSVEGHGPGETLNLTANTSTIRVRAEARSLIPFDRLEIIASGSVICGSEATGTPPMAVMETEIPIRESGWLAARCWGEQLIFPSPVNQRVFGHTSAVYLNFENQPPPADSAVIANLLGHLERTLAWVQKEGRFDNDRQRDHLTGIFQSARASLLKR